MSVNKMVVSSSSSRFPSNASRLGPTDSRDIPSDESDSESTVSSKKRIRVRTNSRMRDNPTTSVWRTIGSVNPQPVSSRSLSVSTNLTNFTNTTGMEDFGSRLGNDSFLQPPPVKMAKNLEHGREVQMYSQRTTVAAANATDHSSNVDEYQRRYNINRPAERSNFTNRIAQTTTTTLPQENVAHQQNSNNNFTILKIDSKFVSHNWTFFSMWRPSWESILKSANEKKKFPMHMNEFCQEVMAAINHVTASPIKRQLIRVFTVNTVEQEEVSGVICQFLDVVETTHFKKPFGLPPQIGKKLISLVLESDIIICLDEDPMEGNATINRSCLVHVTSRDEVNDYGDNSKMLEYDNVEHISYKYIQDPTAKREKYHVLEFIGHSTCSSDTDDEGRGTTINRVNLNHQFENMEIDEDPPILSRDSNSENMTRQGQNSEAGVIDLSEGNNLSQTSRRSIELFENSSDGDNSAEENPPDDGFNLEHFVKNGSFVPGPCRPKLKKGNPNEDYKYDSLRELALKLNSSITADIERGRQATMVVPSYCHTYGVVVDVMQEHRHQNAYFVRISDETMESVLLRIHSSAQDKVKKGPQIKVGHIIRVHRVTAQMEWDSALNDNGMVLSTGNHRNYVIFEQSGEKRYTFIFDTCAMNPSWHEYDKIRVGKLMRFKFNHCDKRRGEENVTDQARSKDNLQNVQLVRGERYPSSSSIGSGIAAIDVRSPSHTPDANEPVPMDIVVNRVSASPQEGSHSQVIPLEESNSDDLFETARNTQQSVVNSDANVPIPSQSQQQPECSNSNGTGVGSNHHQVLTPIQSQDQNVILFKDLKKTAEPLNLLCRVLALVADSKKNMFHLIVEDLERTMPSAAFWDESNSLMISHDQPESLRLNITNARKLLENSKEIVKELQEDQRTDELYSIKNVKMKGQHPPFQLEVDGSNCVIKRDNTYLMRFMEGTFSNTASSKSSNPEALSMQASSSTSSNQATGHSSSNNNSWDKNLNERPEWTGRPRGRRKPREHYQAEETFEC